MTTLLERIGSAIWRSSWQAAILALLIFALLKVSGDRLTPRWRFLLWSVVLARFLFIAAPGSSWSLFNLIPRHDPAITERIADRIEGDPTDSERQSAVVMRELPSQSAETQDGRSPSVVSGQRPTVQSGHETTAATAVSTTSNPARTPKWTMSMVIKQCLPWVWLAGCALSLWQLLAAALLLRRRLSTCRRVTDRAVLIMLETTSQRIGIRRLPTLLVSPESFSPCIVGTWNPRLVVPESIVTESPPSCLRHVLAHELAHLVRGDLSTNWVLLATRVVHWFNPIAWWTVRELQAEREAACDELALQALGEAERTAYAHTIIELTASLLPSALVPGLIGLFSSARRLKHRVERLVRPTRSATIRGPIAAGVLVGCCLLGLTDAKPPSAIQSPKDAAGQAAPAQIAASNKPAVASDYAIRGRCIDHTDNAPLAGMNILLFKAEGRTSPPVEVARTVTDAKGLFEFTGLAPPRPGDRPDSLTYGAFAKGRGRPYGVQFFTSPPRKPEEMEIRMARDKASVIGRVMNDKGQPVAQATVFQKYFQQGAIPGVLSAQTDADGWFEIDDLPVWRFENGDHAYLTIVHPDYPETSAHTDVLPADIRVKLPTGCIVTGSVTDGITGQRAVGSVVTLQNAVRGDQTVAATDAAGRFRAVVSEGRYNVFAEAKERVCVAKTLQECLAGETVNLPTMTLVGGGFISGQVINTATGQPVNISDSNEPISIGLYGPSQPRGGVLRAYSLATVDHAGRFVMRAAAGENFPYFINTHGDRMMWNTLKQPPVVVNEGKTTSFNMLITPPISPEKKLKAARKVVARLSNQPSDRTAQILAEFRKLSKTVDETELWCMLMRELVALGPAAVPQICDELDRTTEDRTQRRLAFALRAIGDTRAVPALIRSIPKTLQPPSSDYGLIVEDAELAAFMQKHDLSKSQGQYFDLGRPPREVFGALHKLTGQHFQDAQLFSMYLSDDPRRAVIQRRIFMRQAQRWETWWNANWRTLTEDAAYQKANLPTADEALPPAPDPANLKARLGDGVRGEVLSPVAQTGQYAVHFLDLDTGFQPGWPVQIAKDEAHFDQKQLADWAAKNGVDLMCITHRLPDGTPTYVLRGFNLKAWEISSRDLRNIDQLVANNKLPQGPDVGQLLMHYDSVAKQFVPDANAAFLFVTREGNLGLIEITDRVTRTADFTGAAYSDSPSGEGFFKGVRFNMKPIVPAR